MALATQIYQERRARIAEMRERERKAAEEALKYYVPGARTAAAAEPEPEPTPPETRDLILWIKCDELTGNDGDKIDTLVDASGEGHDFSRQDVSRRASLRVAHQNGLNVAEFVANSGSNTWYVGPDNLFSAATTGATMYMVLRNANENTNNSLHNFDGPTGNSNHFPFSDGTIYDGFGSNSRKTVGNPTPSMVAYHIYCWKSKNGEWKFFMDGVELFSTGTNTLSFDANGKDLGIASWLGHVAEIIITPIYDDASQQDEMQDYLVEKWGLTI